MINATLTYEYSDIKRNILLDEFLTPTELIEACFEQAIVPHYAYPAYELPKRILDVGANDGRWGKMARKYFPHADIVGIEIMSGVNKPDEYDVWYTKDFITFEDYPSMKHYDLIVGNPPFTVKEIIPYVGVRTKYKAEEFVRKAHSLLNKSGTLAFLLRSNFRHALEREDLFDTMCPVNVYDCGLRPSFYKEDTRTEQYGTKQTNAHDYALFVWWESWLENYYMGRRLNWNYKE